MELVLDRLTKQYKNKIAVDRLNVILHQGVYGLLGANGAGKTTLMRMICGIIKPTGGEVTFNGISVNSEEYRDVLGYLPQNFGYYPSFTALNFLLYMASLKGIPKYKAKQKAMELLEVVSLTDMAHKKIKTFSGGMKQRLGIAQALLNNPQILILDEPTAGLDPKERIRFRNMISQLGKDRIVLLSTHIVSDVEYIADTILIMKNGEIIHKGSLEDIIKVIDNKVWESKVTSCLFDELSASYPVINTKQDKNDVLIRLISDKKPCAGAASVTPTLEDLYLYYFSEGSRDESSNNSNRI